MAILKYGTVTGFTILDLFVAFSLPNQYCADQNREEHKHQGYNGTIQVFPSFPFIEIGKHIFPGTANCCNNRVTFQFPVTKKAGYPIYGIPGKIITNGSLGNILEQWTLPYIF